MMNPMVYVRNQPEAPAAEQPKQQNVMGFPFQQGGLDCAKCAWVYKVLFAVLYMHLVMEDCWFQKIFYN